MPDNGAVKENEPKKYRGLLARAHWRALFMHVQNARPSNRTHDRWLNAANTELEALAKVKISVGATIRIPVLENPEEMVDHELSHDALSGVKLALVQSIKGCEGRGPAPFAERRDLMKAAAGFGTRFRDILAKEAKLPESDDLNEDEEDFSEEEKKPEAEKKKEEGKP